MAKRLLSVLLLCLLAFVPTGAFTGIALDDSTSGRFSGFGTSVTIAFTTAGTNRELVVTFVNVTIAVDACVNVTGVTYAGVSMTQVAALNNGAANFCLLQYALVAPATGSNTLEIDQTVTSSFTGGNIISLTGVSQTGQPEASHTASGTGTTLSNSITTLTANAWVLIGGTGMATDVTGSTNVTQTGTSNAIMGYNGPVVSPGAIALSIVPGSGADTMLSIVSAYAPVGGSPVVYPGAIINSPIICCGSHHVR